MGCASFGIATGVAGIMAKTILPPGSMVFTFTAK